MSSMEVRYIGKNDFMTGKIYVVLSIEDDDYRIVDESGEDYPYPIDPMINLDGVTTKGVA